MDIAQTKLTKLEWESIEIPVSEEESEILILIKNGFSDTNIKYNKTQSLFAMLKIEQSDNIDKYLFQQYIANNLKTTNILIEIPTFNTKKMAIKKMTQMKLKNCDSSFETKKKNIYEFIVVDIINKLAKSIQNNDSEYATHFYTLYKMSNLHVSKKNEVLMTYCQEILNRYERDIRFLDVIKHGCNIIERNTNLLKYGDIKLFDHQKRIFSIFNNEEQRNASLTLYIAPTATGKTLTPIGLSEKHRIIFICAARHVGLALAKSAISIGKKIALAFNCVDASGIRLHYFAATDYTRDWRSGGIRKVDNSVGDKVEIMICDVKSYISAMYYMMSFNDKQNIITYWDEPTIAMDCEEHDLHDMIHTNWQENLIPNIVLSSATLPKQEDIHETIADFRSRFQGDVHSIISHDCQKTIPITDADCYTALPHLLWENYMDLVRSVEHCNQNKTLLRYFDLQQIVDFLMYANTHEQIVRSDSRYYVNNYFESIYDIHMTSIKTYYLDVLSNITPQVWSEVYEYFKSRRKKNYISNTKMVTNDSHTLTDGPSIFLAEDISKVAKVCIKTANIPQKVMQDLNESIEFNNKLNDELRKLDQSFEDMKNKMAVSEDSKKFERMSKDETPNSAMKTLKTKIDAMRALTKVIQLNDLFIPNRKEHLSKWVDEGKKINNPFTCNISEQHVIKIMELDNVIDSWKILLLMGIGVFTEHDSIDYTEIMKELAREQKLFMIIASSNYIYGTNYQFCHGYIGKDMSENMTQEKCIQAMGRVGRNKIQQTYSVRFRDNELIKRLLLPEENKIEVRIMNRLFNSE
jgi:hypothetical protein